MKGFEYFATIKNVSEPDVISLLSAKQKLCCRLHGGPFKLSRHAVLAEFLFVSSVLEGFIEDNGYNSFLLFVTFMTAFGKHVSE